ncbi:hypothetical protein MC28_4036 [Bacillus thuringiensis MC28]|nr:hypothetical protein MC28_4036 [Bacillus thuringiensis MC28]
MNHSLLKGQTIIITEATKRSSLKVFLFTYRRGANIVLVDNETEKLELVILNLGLKKERVLVIQSDLKTSEQRQYVFQTAKKKFGFVNILYTKRKFYYDLKALKALKSNYNNIFKKGDRDI